MREMKNMVKKRNCPSWPLFQCTVHYHLKSPHYVPSQTDIHILCSNLPFCLPHPCVTNNWFNWDILAWHAYSLLDIYMDPYFWNMGRINPKISTAVVSTAVCELIAAQLCQLLHPLHLQIPSTNTNTYHHEQAKVKFIKTPKEPIFPDEVLRLSIGFWSSGFST